MIDKYVMRLDEIIIDKIQVNWRQWTDKEIQDEFQFKQNKPSYVRNYEQQGTKIFSNLKNFSDAVKNGKVTELTPSIQNKIERLAIPKSFEELDDMVSAYRHKRDWKRIKNGYENGHKIPMPLILKFNNRLIIVAGNTRISVYRIMKLPGNPKVLVIDGNKYK